MSATPCSLQWNMNLVSDGMLVCVLWDDEDKFKTFASIKWSNGESKILKGGNYYDFRSEMWHGDGPMWWDVGSSVINASYSFTDKEGVLFRLQVNPNCVQIGEKIEIDFNLENGNKDGEIE